MPSRVVSMPGRTNRSETLTIMIMTEKGDLGIGDKDVHKQRRKAKGDSILGDVHKQRGVFRATLSI